MAKRATNRTAAAKSSLQADNAPKPKADPTPKAVTQAPAATKGEPTATIKINKGEGQQGHVDVQVNGQHTRLAVDTEHQVGAHVLEALNNSGQDVSIIKPLEGAAKGSAAPSSTVGGTANRGQDAVDEPDSTAKANTDQPAPVLKQTTDEALKTDGQNANAEQAAIAEKAAK